MYDFLSRTGALESRAQPYAEVPGELFVEKRCCTIEHTDPNPVVNGMAAPKRLEKAQHGHPRLGVASTQAIEHWLPSVYGASETVFDYAASAPIVLDPETDARRAGLMEQIVDAYESRLALRRMEAEERWREEEQRRRPQEYVADDERRENETTCSERRDHEAHGNVGDEQYDDLSPRRMKPRAPGCEYADARGREAHVPSTETGQDRKRRHCRGPGEGERPCTHRIGCDRLMCRDEQRDRSTEKQQNRRDEGRPRADEDGDRERAGRGREEKQSRYPQRRRCRHAGIVPRDLA